MSSSSGSDGDEESDPVEDTRGVQKVLEELYQQQQRAEILWQQAMEKGGNLGLDARSLLPSPIPLLEFPSSSKCKQEELAEAPDWGFEEIKHLIAVCAERVPVSENPWQPISARMRGKGHSRSADECKRKWENLLDQYKGKSMESSSQSPFFGDLEEVFKLSLNKCSFGGALVEAAVKRSSPPPVPLATSDKFLDVNGSLSAEEVDSDEHSHRKRRKTETGVHQVLLEFVSKQDKAEKRWLELLERKQMEWRRREDEWLKRMELLERQAIEWDTSVREQEEERRSRDEARAQNWDHLLELLTARIIAD